MKNWLTSWLSRPALRFAVTGDCAPDSPETARAEILLLLEEMTASANAHDAEWHLSFYASDPDLRFVIHDRAIVGWNALLEQQRVWWQDGRSDVVYTMVGEPHFRMPQPGLVVVSYFLASERSTADGTTKRMPLAISAVWQRRPEGWKIIYAHESTSVS